LKYIHISYNYLEPIGRQILIFATYPTATRERMFLIDIFAETHRLSFSDDLGRYMPGKTISTHPHCKEIYMNQENNYIKCISIKHTCD
jgi:hypothetical protein